MHKIRKKPNVARKSGFSGPAVPRELASMDGRELTEKSDKSLDASKLTEEQKIKLRAAGYLNI